MATDDFDLLTTLHDSMGRVLGNVYNMYKLLRINLAGHLNF